MNIGMWLHQTALSWPDRNAVFFGDDLRHSYRSLQEAVCARACQLADDFGIAKGDRVAVFAKNTPEILEIFHACWWVGAVIVPVNCKLHPREASWIIENSGAKLVYTETGSVFTDNKVSFERSIFDSVPNTSAVFAPIDLNGRELAWLFYTSGTTGKPKGVMLNHDNLREMTMCYALDVDAPRLGDHVLYAAPISHGAGLYLFAHIRAGGAHIFPRSRGFDCGEIVALAKSRGNLVFFAAPTMVKRLVSASQASGYDGEGIRTIIYGGGPMYANDLDEAVSHLGSRFVQIYGQGESPMTISALSRELVADESQPRWRERRGSVGIAQSCVMIGILDPGGARLGPGEIGEICVQSPTVMQGYWNDPTSTEETLRDGWLHTGDLGYLDKEGFLYLTDRSRDVIISGGTNIYPREVEEALLGHPDIFEVAVIGEPDPEWGEQVVAYVVAQVRNDIDPTDLDKWCRQQIAAFKRPKRYIFVSELPKNGYGKILKSELRATAAQAAISA